MVRQGHRGCTVFSRAAAEAVDAAGAIQERVFRVNVEMYELRQPT
jgi:hypothetical protein